MTRPGSWAVSSGGPGMQILAWPAICSPQPSGCRSAHRCPAVKGGGSRPQAGANLRQRARDHIRGQPTLGARVRCRGRTRAARSPAGIGPGGKGGVRWPWWVAGDPPRPGPLLRRRPAAAPGSPPGRQGAGPGPGCRGRRSVGCRAGDRVGLHRPRRDIAAGARARCPTIGLDRKVVTTMRGRWARDGGVSSSSGGSMRVSGEQPAAALRPQAGEERGRLDADRPLTSETVVGATGSEPVTSSVSGIRGAARRPAADGRVCTVSWAVDRPMVTVVVRCDPVVRGPDVAPMWTRR
jgi:hypothetical protein